MDRIVPSHTEPVICWWSGGITSAKACEIAIDIFGIENCELIMIDTKNEHPDTYRFQMDCEELYGKKIKKIMNEKYDSIQEVWYKYNSLNVANGAICSSELKREVRKKYLKENPYSYNVYGFEFNKKEFNRALSMKINYPETNPIFPLQMFGMDKQYCVDYFISIDIKPPATYYEGLENNNCWQTGCVQGGIGYWQWMERNQPDKFDEMARVEHELTDRAGEPVTINKDQSKEAKQKPAKQRLVFLKPHPDYPENKDLSMMDGREPEPLMECNGFCGLGDLNENDEPEINFQTELTF